MIKHLNTGRCFKCEAIAGKYRGLHEGLWTWFQHVQEKWPDAHLSCAGRGRVDQDRCFKAGQSRATYGQSAHNYNAAIDIFRVTQQGTNYDPTWFRNAIGNAVREHNACPDVTFKIEWYGEEGSPFYELPHCQVAGWRLLNLKLVEPA